MLLDFYFAIRKAGVPASVKEFLTLLEALDRGVVYGSVDDFYTLSRIALVKDEAYFDRFDLAFAAYLKGAQPIPDAVVSDIPPPWLRKRTERWRAPEVLDLDGTIRSAAKNAGWLDLRMVAQLHNAVKVLLFLDVGGSMDDHIKGVEELFSAARSEFKNLEHYYFHNCVYESVWKDNRRRQDRVSTVEVMRKYGHDYKLIFVGAASMSPSEL